MWTRFPLWSSRSGRVVAAVALCAAIAAVDSVALQFDRRTQRRAADAEGVPLLAGPPPGPSWRVRRRFGLELPIALDTRVLEAGLEPAFSLLLPLVTGPRDEVLVVVEQVRSDTGSVPGSLPGIPDLRSSVVYTGVVRGQPASVVVLSVVRGVLYSRVVVGDYAWLLYSDPAGRAYVRLDRRASGSEPVSRPSGASPAVPRQR